MKIIRSKNNFKDYRGSISDIFYNKNIKHISLIITKKGVIRGNLYFKNNTQYIYNLSSTFEYWYKKYNSKSKPKKILVKKGDLVCTPPYEIHALKIVKKNQLLEFSDVVRTKKKYQNDIIRIKIV